VSRRKRPNSKFTPDSPAYLERQHKLAEIRKRIAEGKSFGDLQGYEQSRHR
jgi:hypothetical protein